MKTGAGWRHAIKSLDRGATTQDNFGSETCAEELRKLDNTLTIGWELELNGRRVSVNGLGTPFYPVSKEPDMSDVQSQRGATFTTNIKLPAGVHDFETEDTANKVPSQDPIKRVIYIDERIIPGSFYVEAVWVVGSIPRSHPEHYHDHDEIVGFVSSDMDDPANLGAEIDFVVDGVKHTITKTCFIHIPAGVKHGGLCFRKIDRPVFQIAMSTMGAYASVPPT